MNLPIWNSEHEPQYEPPNIYQYLLLISSPLQKSNRRLGVENPRIICFGNRFADHSLDVEAVAVAALDGLVTTYLHGKSSSFLGCLGTENTRVTVFSIASMPGNNHVRVVDWNSGLFVLRLVLWFATCKVKIWNNVVVYIYTTFI